MHYISNTTLFSDQKSEQLTLRFWMSVQRRYPYRNQQKKTYHNFWNLYWFHVLLDRTEYSSPTAALWNYSIYCRMLPDVCIMGTVKSCLDPNQDSGLSVTTISNICRATEMDAPAFRKCVCDDMWVSMCVCVREGVWICMCDNLVFLCVWEMQSVML